MARDGKPAEPDWAKIRRRYERGGISQRDLAASEGVPYPTLRDHSKRDGWAVQAVAARSEAVARGQQKAIERGALAKADIIAAQQDFHLLALSKAQAMLEMVDQPKDLKAATETGRIAIDGLRQSLDMDVKQTEGTKADDDLDAAIGAADAADTALPS